MTKPQTLTLKEVQDLATRFLMKTGTHPQVLFVTGERGTAVAQLPDLPENSEIKQGIFNRIGEEIAKDQRLGQLKSVYFVSEAWATIQREKPKKYTRPSLDPKRVEMLVIAGLNLTKQPSQEGISFKMIRNEKGNLVKLEKQTEGEFESPLLKAFLVGYLTNKREKPEEENPFDSFSKPTGKEVIN